MLKLRSNKGFTMVELLIVLAIIAILAAVAIPIYSSQLENSRIKVDESNLRAATGLAAQDYIVRFASNEDIAKRPIHPDASINTDNGLVIYRVYGLVDDVKSANKISSQNMVVLPGGYKFDAEGKETTGKGAAPAVVLDVPPETKALTYGKIDGRNDNKKNREKPVNNGKFQGKDVVWFPIQQNGGNAWFDIVIGTNGVIFRSQIRTS